MPVSGYLVVGLLVFLIVVLYGCYMVLDTLGKGLDTVNEIARHLPAGHHQEQPPAPKGDGAKSAYPGPVLPSRMAQIVMSKNRRWKKIRSNFSAYHAYLRRRQVDSPKIMGKLPSVTEVRKLSPVIEAPERRTTPAVASPRGQVLAGPPQTNVLGWQAETCRSGQYPIFNDVRDQARSALGRAVCNGAEPSVSLPPPSSRNYQTVPKHMQPGAETLCKLGNTCGDAR